MPKGKWDWMIFTALAAWILYVFWNDMGGFIATLLYALVIYGGYLTTRWLKRRVTCYG